MIRVTRRHLLLCLSAIAIIVLAIAYRPWMLSAVQIQRQSDLAARRSVVNISYILAADQWLEFQIPAEEDSLRLTTSAAVKSGMPVGDDPRSRYAVLYQLLDAGKRVIEQREYHFVTQVTQYISDTEAKPRPGWYYFNEPLTPTDPQSLLLDLARDESRGRYLRVKVLSRAPELEEICLRVYARRAIPVYRQRSLWARMAPWRKQLLSRANVYEAEMLAAAEKENLLRDEWEPLAPLGIAGMDYQRKKIFRVIEPQAKVPLIPVTAAGVPFDRGLAAVIPLPEQGGDIELEVEAARADSLIPPDSAIELFWYGRGFKQRSRQSVPLVEGVLRFRNRFDGGLLELRSAAALVARAYLINGEERTDITPDATIVRGYRPQPEMPVVFEVLHDKSLPTPFRLDLRAALSGSDRLVGAVELSAAVEFLGPAGESLQEHQVRASKAVSRYDQLRFGDLLVPISDPESLFFSLPREVVQVRVRAVSADVLVTAYNRPPALARVLNAPEDYYAFNRDTVAQRAWYLLRPRSHMQFLRSGNALPIVAQSRPPEDDPRIASGDYRWISYDPAGSWRGRYILYPQEKGNEARHKDLRSLYAEVPLNRDLDVEFLGEAWQKTLAPLVFCVSSGGDGCGISVAVDGRTVLNSGIRSSRFEGELAPLAPGPHKLHVRAGERTRVFLNSLILSDAPLASKQLALVLDAQGLAFSIDKSKSEAEMLTLRLHQPMNGSERTVVRVSVVRGEMGPGKGIVGPLADWTFSERVFSVRQPSGAEVPVLNTDDDFVGKGEPLLIPLGSDLPPGKYDIRVRLEKGDPVYAVLSRNVPGESDAEAVIRERRRSTDVDE